jgi:hypothetical protein
VRGIARRDRSALVLPRTHHKQGRGHEAEALVEHGFFGSALKLAGLEPESLIWAANMLGRAVDQYERQTASLHLAEPVTALSLATDLGMGQPMESVLLAAVLGVRLASLFGVSDAELSGVCYVALLRFVGCNADAHVAAETFGDELVAREHFAEADYGRPTSVLATLLRHLGADQPPARRERILLTAFANMPRLYGTALAHCEVGQLLQPGLAGHPTQIVEQLLLDALLGANADLVDDPDEEVHQRIGDLPTAEPAEGGAQRGTQRRRVGPQLIGGLSRCSLAEPLDQSFPPCCPPYPSCKNRG